MKNKAKGAETVNYIMYLTLAIITVVLVILFIQAGLSEGENTILSFISDFITESGLEEEGFDQGN